MIMPLIPIDIELPPPLAVDWQDNQLLSGVEPADNLDIGVIAQAEHDWSSGRKAR